VFNCVDIKCFWLHVHI